MKTVLILCSLVFGLLSCQKEESLENGPINPPPNGTIDSNYIDKVYYLLIDGPLKDTLEIWTYNYDNLKRVSSMTLKPTDPLDLSITKFDYFYTNADTLPYKTIFLDKEESGGMISVFYDTTFHTYNNSGKNIKDSVNASSGSAGSVYSYVTTYTYAANKIYGYTIGNSPGNPTFEPSKKDTATLDAAGNILNNKLYHYNNFSSNWELFSVSDFTYDTKISPFSRLSNFRTFSVFPSGETLVYELPQIYNRLTQREESNITNGGPGGLNHFDYNYTNTYKSNGYLKESSGYSQPVTTSEYEKIIITYRAL